MKPLLLFIALPLLAQQAGEILTVTGPSSAKTGTAIQFSITVGEAGTSPTAAGLQWTVGPLPTGFTLQPIPGPVTVAAGKALDCTPDGTTCVVAGFNQNIIQDGVVVNYTMSVPSSATPGAVPITLTNTEASDVNGVAIPVLPGIPYSLTIAAGLPHGIQSEETPAGVIDGTNGTFSLLFQPLPWASIHVYRAGLRYKRGLDYILTGPSHQLVVFQPCCIPQVGDVLVVDYTY